MDVSGKVKSNTLRRFGKGEQVEKLTKRICVSEVEGRRKKGRLIVRHMGETEM